MKEYNLTDDDGEHLKNAFRGAAAISTDQADRIDLISHRAYSLAVEICKLTPPGGMQDQAISNLLQSLMWATRAIREER